MPAITIRDVPEDARNELASRAARSGRSLQEFLRSELIDLARKPDVNSVIERARQRKAVSGGHVTSDSLLEHLHTDRP